MRVGERGRASARKVVPARFMEPRVIFCLVVVALCLFGLVMIYSASSVTMLKQTGDAYYLLKRQAALLAGSLVFSGIVVLIGYRRLCSPKAVAWLTIIIVALLVCTRFFGVETKGAVRWIDVKGIQLQPSEFAKPIILLSMASLCQRYFSDGEIDFGRFCLLSVACVVLPVGLILAQPDKGTTLIIAAAVAVMLLLAGFDWKLLVVVFLVVGGLVLLMALRDPYSLKRIEVMHNPEKDPLHDGYQLLQGFHAIANGGVFGCGIGMSRQKYGYLPEKHNDFIFAIVGEECGLVGMLLVLAAFLLIAYEGHKISRDASDLAGSTLAMGASSLLVVQFFVNVLGVIGITPMTGKPLPFLSYGGSSILSCVVLCALVLSVSRESSLPETVYERRRGNIGLAGPSESVSRRPRGYDREMGVPMTAGFRVVEGGAECRGRVDLGPSPHERLRGGSARGTQQNGRSHRGRPDRR